MKRGIADAISYVKNLLGLVRQEPVPLLRIEPAASPVSSFDEDISSNVGHFNFNRWRVLKETGGQINTEFYDEEGELLD
jgi:hypothetical protein